MGIISPSVPQVNSMSLTTDLTTRLKRDHAFHRAAQLLADAVSCRSHVSPKPLSTMSAIEREWFKQTARHLIEVFEVITLDKPPDAEIAAAEVTQRAEQLRAVTARESRLAIERSRARVAAADRGHVLGPWGPTHDCPGEEMARCVRCPRYVRLSLQHEPVLVGLALTEGCLASARPDPFLAGQPDAAREEGQS